MRQRELLAESSDPKPQIRMLLSELSDGAPEEIRTPDPQIRSLVLYPAELRALIPLPETGSRTAA